MVDTTNHAQGIEAPTGTDSRAVRLGRGFRRAVITAAGGTSVNPLDRESYAQATNRGYGEATGRGFELALVLVVFGGIGWLVDRVTGRAPLFFLIFAVVGFAGVAVKLWLGYDLEMREHDKGAVWSRSRRSTTGKGMR
ncbi:MAG: AtpZ/AtpI family protein [Acidimicrobiales bacterium]|nr:AtpZ/AtpI family protein [Acidimicrobiales bacterium]